MIDSSSPERAPGADRKYGNFRDPFGLVWRMLTSGNRAAYGALVRAGLSLGTVPLDWLLQRQERRRLAAADPARQPHPLVFVVGPPRSGSTLLYQTLARYTEVSYVSNLTALFPRSPITATRLLQGRGQRGGDDFQSYYGQTAGLSAPNDGFEVWNRWLGGDRYETPTSLDAATVDDMRRFFAAWTAEFDRPFLNKNNRNTHCLRLLAEALPAAHFVVIRRDPLFVAQSLIEARLRVQGAKERSWGLSSSQRHAEAHEPLGYVDDVCDQIRTIEDQLCDQSAAVDATRIVETTYEQFCRQPQETIQIVVEAVPKLRIRDHSELDNLPPFRISSTVRLTDEERSRIEQRLSEVSPIVVPGLQPHLELQAR